ncbi:hypothetical protein IW261DRAFT_1474663 [Armillaria novae-zelandiae]|uniref:Secreted protein n=1 Tax=Armillaria novae-zelandiae TaxID=153914 RepID=A0AA39PCC8_9AGAR|nr:hypothetical protein IW261DRAFT_1474663 [Armillaria novae-zelandiae]
MKLMVPVIPFKMTALLVLSTSTKSTFQTACPFSMNAEDIINHSTAKLIVVRAWRKMIKMTMAHWIGQHLLKNILHNVIARIPV